MNREELYEAILDGSIDEKYEDQPYGVIYITNGLHPRILYINDKMKSFVSVKYQNADWQRLEDDIYLSVPYMERRDFENDLNRASLSRDAIEVCHNFICADGSVKKFQGFMKAQRGSDPDDLIFKLTYRPVNADNPERSAYQVSVVNALKKAYDIVLHLDTQNHYCEFTKCSTLRGEQMYRGVKVLVNPTFDNFLGTVIDEEDRGEVRELLNLAQNESFPPVGTPAECEFRLHTGHNINRYYCTYVKLNMRDVYICLNCTGRTPESGAEEAEKEVTRDIPVELPYEKEIRVRTFGYFDIFVNGRAIPFKNKKGKELLALLIARNGGFVSPDEIVGCLWENEDVNKSTLARIRKTYFSLVQELKEYGIGDLVESQGSQRRVVSERIDSCDLYQTLSGEKAGGRPENFLRNYAWGEYIADDLFEEGVQIM